MRIPIIRGVLAFHGGLVAASNDNETAVYLFNACSLLLLRINAVTYNEFSDESIIDYRLVRP